MIDTGRFRSLLETERTHTLGIIENLRAEIASVGASRRDAHLDGQDPEEASTDSEISKESSLLQLSVGRLHEIEAALARITDGSYGTCVVCGNEIAEGRLEARPWTPYCIDHAVDHRGWLPPRHKTPL